MIVNLIDSESGNSTLPAARRSTAGTRVAVIDVYSTMSLESILDRVISACTHPRSIWLLRIMSHGTSGHISIGKHGISRYNCHELQALRDYMTPGGIGVAVHSCGPASDTYITRNPEGWFEELITGDNSCTIPGTIAPGGGSGVNFLRQIAKFMDCPVRGGVHTQRPDSEFRFEGVTIAVSPRGAAMAVPDKGRLALDTTRIF
ncbi:MAG: hypothetical protein DWQ47_04575 [Acidobacteria bacterium]|nr:MAG: hypothetical protein DWQ32_08125 [Acidobacteriota bacterium]REK01663.1 MAG: hypothetical protein DWQ38_04560 [Acidobacteriota bacterium]REK14619.1 MAG: hypothetical protein DWQ43_13815 [Acidobacteriota bacterium]REK45334.1 MAG: hypothetical protein DWQ47_04575 [Acidobacteriota bacterium]